MNSQFLHIEISLSVSGFIILAILGVIWIIGLIAIGMGLGRRWR